MGEIANFPLCTHVLLRRYGYIEFAEAESVDNALKLDDSMFKGRQLKV